MPHTTCQSCRLNLFFLPRACVRIGAFFLSAQAPLEDESKHIRTARIQASPLGTQALFSCRTICTSRLQCSDTLSSTACMASISLKYTSKKRFWLPVTV